MEPAYVGIDVACAKKKSLPLSVCVRRGNKLTPLPLKTVQFRPPRGGGNILALEPDWGSDFAAQTENYLRHIEEAFSVQIERVAIDAPSEPCRADSGRREAERALDARRISCFTTPSATAFKAIEAKARAHLSAGGPQNRLPHANQLWMLVQFDAYLAAWVASLAEGDREPLGVPPSDAIWVPRLNV